METQTFSRAYLKGIPEQRKQAAIAAIIKSISQSVINSATMEKTSYVYYGEPTQKLRVMGEPKAPEISIDDLVNAMRIVFPDCDVDYKEIAQDMGNNTQIVKTGIVIDWS